MLYGRPRWLRWKTLGSQVVWMESVVGNQHHRRVFIDQFEQTPQHHVVIDVSRCHDMLIHLKIMVFDMLLLRRVVLHEPMTKVINGVVVDRCKIPLLFFQQLSRRGMNRCALGQHSHHHRHTAIGGLIDFATLG